jgi:hypothetical protein
MNRPTASDPNPPAVSGNSPQPGTDQLPGSSLAGRCLMTASCRVWDTAGMAILCRRAGLWLSGRARGAR